MLVVCGIRSFVSLGQHFGIPLLVPKFMRKNVTATVVPKICCFIDAKVCYTSLFLASGRTLSYFSFPSALSSAWGDKRLEVSSCAKLFGALIWDRCNCLELILGHGP